MNVTSAKTKVSRFPHARLIYHAQTRTHVFTVNVNDKNKRHHSRQVTKQNKVESNIRKKYKTITNLTKNNRQQKNNFKGKRR